MTDVLEMREAIRAVATFGLDGLGPTEPFTVSGEDWYGFITEIRNDRLAGLAVAALDAAVLELREEWAEDLVARHRSDMTWVLGLEQKLFEVADAFERAGVEFVVLKGPALAHSIYPDPSWRPFSDLDLLVRTRDWRHACETLIARGCVRRLPEPRPGFDERFGKAAVHRTPENQEIDLHRTLVLGPFGLWINPDELFEHTRSFHVAGRRFTRLGDTEMLLHTCIHAALGQRVPFGQQLRDIRQVMSASAADGDALLDRATRWHLGGVVRRAFALNSHATGAAWPTELASVLAPRPSARESRLLTAYSSDRRRRGATALATLQAIPRLRAKLQYVFALTLPRRDFMAARANDDQGAGTYLARLRKPIYWLAGRAK
jgi:hypothetical protein